MDIYEEIVSLRKAGRRGAVATIINVQGSIPSFRTAKMLVRDDGSMVGTIGGGCVEAEVWQAAREVMEEEKPRTLTFNLNNDPSYNTGLVCGGALEIFVEPVLPPAELFIFGAGHVALYLYQVARVAGFEITVVDDRELRQPRTLPRDARCALRRHGRQPGQAAAFGFQLHGDRYPRTPRRHARAALGGRDPGALCRHDRLQAQGLTVYKELEKEGVRRELLERVHAPIGLDIGAITPEEIAVAIVAEMIAVRHKVSVAGKNKSVQIQAAPAKTES